MNFEDLTMLCDKCGSRHWKPDTYGDCGYEEKCEKCNPTREYFYYEICWSCKSYTIIYSKEHDQVRATCENCACLLRRGKRSHEYLVAKGLSKYDSLSCGVPSGIHEGECIHCNNYIRNGPESGGVCLGCDIKPYGFEVKPAKR
jgi:hypothetical protein